MKTVSKIFAILILVLAIWFLAQMVASESGEVVVLTTQKADGSNMQTRLWVFEYDSNIYLRAGHSEAGWYKQLVANPSVEVSRNEVSQIYMAVPESELQETANQLMREKYGWRDAYISLFFSRDSAIPVRLNRVN